MASAPEDQHTLNPPPLATRVETQRKRRWRLPLALFFATCLTTFWGGAAGPSASVFFYSPTIVREVISTNWQAGLKYMLAVMSILLAHEMGHFLLTLRHRIPASFPFFIPMPLSFIGTMGAVIGMQAYKANRRQLFDIGIAGPLAGLVLAIPIAWVGIQQAQVVPEPTRVTEGLLVLDDPLIVELMIRWLRPDAPEGELYLNPLLMAGWFGFLITGLNMMPISQLDGGHISYALMGRRAYLVARIFVLAAVIFMLWQQTFQWAVMLMLVLAIGIDHPPTADDQVPLGLGRTLLGWASFAIPVLCFPVLGISVL